MFSDRLLVLVEFQLFINMRGERLDIALEFLKDGSSFLVGDIRLRMRGKIIEVIGWSKFNSLNNLTKSIAKEELFEILELFQRMKKSSSNFKFFVDNKEVEYILHFDDYGKGSIKICSLMHEKFNWNIDLEKSSR